MRPLQRITFPDNVPGPYSATHVCVNAEALDALLDERDTLESAFAEQFEELLAKCAEVERLREESQYCQAEDECQSLRDARFRLEAAEKVIERQTLLYLSAIGSPTDEDLRTAIEAAWEKVKA